MNKIEFLQKNRCNAKKAVLCLKIHFLDNKFKHMQENRCNAKNP